MAFSNKKTAIAYIVAFDPFDCGVIRNRDPVTFPLVDFFDPDNQTIEGGGVVGRWNITISIRTWRCQAPG